MTETEIKKTFDEKVRNGVFNPVARHLDNANTAEDRLQTAIALTWMMYHRYATQKDKVLSNGILVHSCKQRAVDLNRDFVPANGSIRNQDVLDPRAYRDGKVEMLRLDHWPGGDQYLQVGYAEAMSIRPERSVNSAIDLEAWVKEQTSSDQLILEKKMEGHTLKHIAADLSMTTSKVFTRAKTLGLDLAKRAGIKIEQRGRS